MKKYLSLLACIAVLVCLVQSRISYPGLHSGKELKVTTWDAFGYYMYLPALFVYKDTKQLSWLDSVDHKYHVTGGDGWQAQKADNGNYVFKYLGGVAIMEMPLFFTGHIIASMTGYPQDGFSPPYQYALGFGIILYCFLAVLLLRRVLLRFFGEGITAITILLICLATNFIQYAAVDNAQSHAYLFVLYVLLLWATIKWHERPKAAWAAAIGYIIGLATMSRPTEAIMLFIPLLWATQNKDAAKAKWALVRQHRSHLLVAVLFGIIGVLPQLIYWKMVSGSFIYDVGSKWQFLDPWFRVLAGWEKGWFIYTPVTIFFILGLFLVKKAPFKNPVIWFCILNIWIIIAWSDWRYGGSYSTRALVQSYPVFALSLAAFMEKISAWRGKALVYVLLAYLLFVNIFQTWQYNKGIIHFNDMNRNYYSAVYLNPHPTPEQVSLLDHDEFLRDEGSYTQAVVHADTAARAVSLTAGEKGVLATNLQIHNNTEDHWLKVEVSLKAESSLWGSYLHADLSMPDSSKKVKVRLYNALYKENTVNRYAFYMRVPNTFIGSTLEVYLVTGNNADIVLQNMIVTRFWK